MLFSGRQELILINHEQLNELAEYCCEAHFPGHALNARYVATEPIRPQRAMPKDHRAIKRAFGRQDGEVLEPDALIEELLKQFSAENIKDNVEFLSTKDGVQWSCADMTRPVCDYWFIFI